MLGIQEVFYWTIKSSAAASIVIGVILLVKLVMKSRQSANWHYYIWFILIMKLLIPYAPESSVSVFNTITPASKILSISQNNIINNSKENILIKNERTEISDKLAVHQGNVIQDIYVQPEYKQSKYFFKNFKIEDMLAIVWAAGVLVLVLYTVFANLIVSLKTSKSFSVNNDGVTKIFNECRKVLNVNKDIPIILTTSLKAPALFGTLRPKLLLPEGIAKKVTDDQLKHIFLHELSHFKRKDNFVNWIGVFLKILHWFNPIIWYGFYKMHEDCEIACDAMVLSSMGEEERPYYGYTIIYLLKATSKSKWMPGTIGMLSGKSQIRRRITMISLFCKKSFKCTVIGVIVLVILSCILLTNSKNSLQFGVKAATVSKSSGSESRSAEVLMDVKSSITVTDIKGNNYNGKIMFIPNPKKVVVGYSLQHEKPDKTTSGIAKAENAIAAINAGAFKIISEDKPDIQNFGFIIKDGKVVYRESADEKSKVDIVGFTKEGNLITGKYTLKQLKDLEIKEAVECGPALIVNGKATEASNLNFGVAPRTAIAQKEDGTVIFLVIDGRSKDSVGAAVKDVTGLLLKYKAVNASLLDGGSSSTMFFNNNVINHPCNPSGERVIPSAFLAVP